MYKQLILSGLMVFIYGCASHNPPLNGTTRIKYQDFDLVNSKEYAHIKLDVEIKASGDKKLKYEAHDAKAFEGQAIAAEVHKQILESQDKITKQMAETVSKTISSALKAYLGGGLIQGAGQILSTPKILSVPEGALVPDNANTQ